MKSQFPTGEVIAAARAEERDGWHGNDQPHRAAIRSWFDDIWARADERRTSEEWLACLDDAIRAYEHAPLLTSAATFPLRYFEMPSEVQRRFWAWVESRFQSVDELSIPLEYYFSVSLQGEEPAQVTRVHAQQSWPENIYSEDIP